MRVVPEIARTRSVFHRDPAVETSRSATGLRLRAWRAAGLGFLLALGFAPAAQADITNGIWRREDGKAHVRIAPCDGVLCAINVWIRDPGDEAVGDRLVLDVKPVGAGVWEGSAFDPKRNLRFSSRITYSGDRMTTSGCMLKVFCKTVAWTRAP